MDNLSGLGVLVTRPEQQANKLCQLIQQASAKAIRFPTIEIDYGHRSADLENVLKQFNHYHILIFISANAVHGAMQIIKDRGGIGTQQKIACVGKASARALQSYHYDCHIVPQQFTSEGLLAHAEMQTVAKQKILIFRGAGGREHLADELRRRQAQVDYAEVYQRVLPQQDPSKLLQQWAQGEIQIVVTTSNEGLENLFVLLGNKGKSYIQATPVVVVSERGQDRAQQLGCGEILMANNASDEAIIEVIKKWYHEYQSSQR